MKLATIALLFLAAFFAAPTFATADPAPGVTFPNANIFFSPYCWRLDDKGAAICPAGGGYFKFKVTGTTQIALQVDTKINAGLTALQMPAVKVVVNAPNCDGAAQYFQFPANTNPDTPITVATGLKPDVTYSVLIQAVGGDETAPHGWDTPVFQTKINQLVLDSGAKLLQPDQRPKRALFLGASYEQAYFGYAKGDAPVYTYVDASLSWPFFVAYALNCEYGQIGIGSQGWVRFGNGDYPAFTISWDKFDATHPKTYTPDLDYVFIHMAENDNAQDDAAVQKAVTEWIPKARAAFGSKTKIFIILSITQIKSAPIKAGVAAAADPKFCLIDPGNEFRHSVFSGAPTWAAPGDGLHLDAVHQGIYTGYVLQHAQAFIDGAGGK
jgi:hypothetical protein